MSWSTQTFRQEEGARSQRPEQPTRMLVADPRCRCGVSCGSVRRMHAFFLNNGTLRGPASHGNLFILRVLCHFDYYLIQPNVLVFSILSQIRIFLELVAILKHLRSS